MFPLSLLIRAMPAGEEVGGEGRGRGSPWAPRAACKHANECQLYKNSPSSHILLQTSYLARVMGNWQKEKEERVCVCGGRICPKDIIDSKELNTADSEKGSLARSAWRDVRTLHPRSKKLP